MPSVNIYGLPPANLVDTKVTVYDSATFGTPTAARLFDGSPNEKGQIKFDIPKSFIGKAITLVAIPDRYNYINESLDVPKLGVFHTVLLSQDMGHHSCADQLPVHPTPWHRRSQEFMRHDHRKAKYQNYFSIGIFSLLTIASPFVGLAWAGIKGMIVGCVITIILLAIGKYSSGQESGI